ncbi:acyl-homoserine-lactone synthase [Phaeobacter piscinae]|uniref:Acyl-homoserine-lactone synthase n=1 Tax=Phaeobacter piscinae TaxID=1580596 RepID=A0ABM6PA81_9RHOB|nr:acyl-homoserine-lactone synthase [Phaeobacter piscinae]ATG34480.1 putative acyl-homoserine-lactone synthase RaiI [Phaeobacter piscinae]ATG38438.1 putative acyl-homoserine-lactone synthase RaiI [Phaeobacter piscinae]AUQ85000.1 putative acyl-homoserine-lactone synthase RaiI [Phaeobacter piscinae]AUR22884.1 putative acyl-homoserine-lactone synthase RaiI [Phaeobacter piscinae]
MLRYVYAHDLHQHRELAHSMFVDRADQFKTRLGWDVSVDAQGEERDEYDALDPLYVIWEQADGRHGGSMRFLPSTGPIMVNDVFPELTGGDAICSPLIWECTRFCLSRDVSGNVAGALTLAGLEIMRNFNIAHFAGVFDRRMVRIYRSLGFSPDVIGTMGEGRDRICLGLWDYSSETYHRVAQKAGIQPELSTLWFDRSFGGAEEPGPVALTG